MVASEAGACLRGKPKNGMVLKIKLSGIEGISPFSKVALRSPLVQSCDETNCWGVQRSLRHIPLSAFSYDWENH